MTPETELCSSSQDSPRYYSSVQVVIVTVNVACFLGVVFRISFFFYAQITSGQESPTQVLSLSSALRIWMIWLHDYMKLFGGFCQRYDLTCFWTRFQSLLRWRKTHQFKIQMFTWWETSFYTCTSFNPTQNVFGLFCLNFLEFLDFRQEIMEDD